MQYLLTLHKLTVYQTEWSIWASDERLAGSIDCVAQDADGQLVLFDWKKSKQLSSKYNSDWRKMAGALQHLDDCAGIHYRLQVNAYKWILERYYDVTVASMHVVRTHPELRQLGAFVDNVPDMPLETDAIMQYQCLMLDEIDDTALRSENHEKNVSQEESSQGRRAFF